eukprot:scaffold476099_cov17-Prasinocladus_malaysianus.AAC.1
MVPNGGYARMPSRSLALAGRLELLACSAGGLRAPPCPRTKKPSVHCRDRLNARQQRRKQNNMRNWSFNRDFYNPIVALCRPYRIVSELSAGVLVT